MPIQQTDERLFKGTTAEILAFVPPAFAGWTYAESTDNHVAYRWNSTTSLWEPMPGVASAPASPTFFVASTGSDSNPGTSSLPLATPQEALKRLGTTNWTGSPFVIIKDTVAIGANPFLNVPPPIGGASPITTQGFVTQITAAPLGVAPTVPIGGTAGTLSPVPALPTITTGLVTVANAYKGMFVRFTGGALSGIRTPINSNDAAGVFTLTSTNLFAVAAPGPTTPFVVEDLTGRITYSGTLRVSSPGGSWFDLVEFDMAEGISLIDGLVESTGCRFLSTGGTASFTIHSGGEWYDGTFLPQFGDPGALPTPAGVLMSGSRWDGNASVIRYGGANIIKGIQGYASIIGGSLEKVDIALDSNGGNLANIALFGLVGMTTCGVDLRNGSMFFNMSTVIATGMRHTAYLPAAAAAFFFGTGVSWNMALVTVNGTLAGDDVIHTDAGSNGDVQNLSGTNAAANVPLVASKGAKVVLRTQPTITGGTAGSEVKVGANVVTTWALAFGGLTANSTDLGAASSQMVRVGP